MRWNVMTERSLFFSLSLSLSLSLPSFRPNTRVTCDSRDFHASSLPLAFLRNGNFIVCGFDISILCRRIRSQVRRNVCLSRPLPLPLSLCLLLYVSRVSNHLLFSSHLLASPVSLMGLATARVRGALVINELINKTAANQRRRRRR